MFWDWDWLEDSTVLTLLQGGGAPAISVSPTSWDFGSTPVGTPVSKIFTIENTGTAALEITLPITIVGAEAEAFSVTDQPDETSLAPGASTTFIVQADADVIDTFSADISITSNAGSSPTLIPVSVVVEIDYLLDDVGGLVALYAFAPRLLRRQYAGQCLRLRRTSDNVESDFGFDSNGDLDIVAISTWLNGNSGAVVTWYDQSGNGLNGTMATTTKQPFYTASAISGRPGILFSDVNNLQLDVPNTSLLSLAAATVFAIAKMDADGIKTASAIFAMNNGGADSAFAIEQLSGASDATGALRIRFGSPNLAQSSATYNWNDVHLISAKASNGAALRLWVDGVEPAYSTQNNAATLPATFPSSAAIGQDSSTRSVDDYEGYVSEVVLIGSALSDADRQAAEANIGDYY